MDTRRAFVRRAVAAAGALAAGRAITPIAAFGTSQRTVASQRVVVLGAGLAGLAAAYELRKVGHSVVVLEARRQPGGRVLTLRDGFADGQYAEAGGEAFYPVAENYAARYVQEFGLTRRPGAPGGLVAVWHLRGRTVRSPGGTATPWPVNLTAREQELGLNGIRQTYLTPALDELAALLDPSNAGWSAQAIERFDTTSFAELLRARGASPAAIELLRIADNDYIGEGADQYAAIAMIGHGYNVRAASRFLRGAFFSIEGGNDRLPQEFARRLDDAVRYNCIVRYVEQNTDGVRVGYSSGSGDESAEADYAVCTIPFSVIRTIDLRQAISPAKAAAINGVSYASLARTYIQCLERFWVAQGLSGRASTDLPTTYFSDSTAGQPGPRGIMHGYIMGQHARAFAALNAEARKQFALRQAEQVFPGIESHAETVASVSWDEDPYSRGAYSYLKPGDASRLFPHLGQPEGRIHFAGEHTSTWFLQASMQGALESGVRAARAIDELASRGA